LRDRLCGHRGFAKSRVADLLLEADQVKVEFLNFGRKFINLGWRDRFGMIRSLAGDIDTIA
jgi:hypothetical protein